MSELMTKATATMHALNGYFFDVEPHEAPDYVSAAIFYGTILLCLLASAGVLVALLLG